MDKQKAINTLLFDLDGTLFHLAVDWDVVTKEVETIIKRPVKSFNKLYEDRSHVHHSAVTNKVTDYELAGVKRGRTTKAAGQVIGKLSKNYQIGIVTRNSRYAAEEVIQTLGIDRVNVIVGREDVAKLKPDPEALKQALIKLNANKNQTILIGDTVQDVLAAHSLGIKCVIVKNNKLTFTPEGADFYINSLLELEDVLQKVNKE